MPNRPGATNRSPLKEKIPARTSARISHTPNHRLRGFRPLFSPGGSGIGGRSAEWARSITISNTNKLADDPDAAKRPEDEHRLADDPVPLECSPEPAVVRVVAVITHDKQLFRIQHEGSVHGVLRSHYVFHRFA